MGQLPGAAGPHGFVLISMETDVQALKIPDTGHEMPWRWKKYENLMHINTILSVFEALTIFPVEHGPPGAPRPTLTYRSP